MLKLHTLWYIHLDSHSFSQLSSSHGFANLRSLKLVALRALEELPDFGDLKELERLMLMAYRRTMCCNSFL
uniref:Uncharacterized protein n=1 Tax=Globisporangium ultimum (strain ATCC 200006 / CBS 805.95 / DAOM BR144) TaxID=431595 RepID=K3WTE8_GLOUD